MLSILDALIDLHLLSVSRVEFPGSIEGFGHSSYGCSVLFLCLIRHS